MRKAGFLKPAFQKELSSFWVISPSSSDIGF